MFTQDDLLTPEETLDRNAQAETRPVTSADILFDICVIALRSYKGEEIFVKITDYDSKVVSEVTQRLAIKRWSSRRTVDREETPVLAITKARQ